MHESHRIEFKEKITNEIDLEKEVVAFLNNPEGGIIYIGIKSNGQVLGLLNLDADALKIKDRIKNNIRPSPMGLFDISCELIKQKSVLKVTIASGCEKPYFKKRYGMSEKGCYMRMATSSEPMPQEIIDKLYSSRVRTSVGKIKSHQQRLSFEKLRIYYEEKGRPLNKQFKNNLEFFTPSGNLNYIAYLLADQQNISVQVAKYKGTSKAELIENNEYGNECLIKSLKSVLDKINLENTTLTKITSIERQEKRLWHEIALREAIINAFVHNDYTTELAPTFEIFSDRLVITSRGALPHYLGKQEFFEGVSAPRNKELMRIFRDLDLIEQLGSGVPRILEHYEKNCFKFSENHIIMSFPKSFIADLPDQVTYQVKLLLFHLSAPLSGLELMEKLKLTHRSNFRENYIHKAIMLGLIVPTIPDKPKSSKQKYRLTPHEHKIRNQLYFN